MGKSAAAKKKKTAAVSTTKNKVDTDAVTFLDRARELKEEGNQLFKASQLPEAYDKYGQALKVAPEGHEDRAVLHSNRAACMLQMRPVPYDEVIKECTAALELKPKFGRALLRRAKAYEALANYPVALEDVETLLESDAENEDAREAQKRLKARLKASNGKQAAQPARGMVNPPASPSAGRAQQSPPPAAEAVSNGKAAPAAAESTKGGAALPPRPPPPAAKGVPGLGLETKTKNKSAPARTEESVEGNVVRMPQANGVHQNGTALSKGEGSHPKASRAALGGGGENGGTSAAAESVPSGAAAGTASALAGEGKATKKAKQAKKKAEVKPPILLKLLYDRGSDLRKAEMPRQCGPGGLREIVRKRFPSSKAVLIKYQDEEGDRVTITNREEFDEGIAGYLKQCEEDGVDVPGNSDTASVEATVPQTDVESSDGKEKVTVGLQNGTHSSAKKKLAPLRLYIVEVDPDQEPTFPEDDPEKEDEEEEEEEEEVVAEVENAATAGESVAAQDGEKGKEGPSGEEIEIDDWVIDFANLFRHHLGIDPDSHVDIHELGMELCQQAMDETVSCPDAMPLFESAAMKFEEVVALAYHNWGNVHTCIAKKYLNDDPHAHVHGRKEGEEPQPRKRSPEIFEKAKEHFAIAAQKYQKALEIKAEFSDAIVGWGQLLFENAKLELERTVQEAGEDSEQWEKLDFSEAVQLFGAAEAKMIAAERAIEETERMMMLKQKEQEQADQGPRAVSDKAAAEGATDPAALLTRFDDYRHQVQLCHGNILFEHSILDHRVGGSFWDILLSKAVTKYLAAGAARDDVINALKNHPASTKNVLQLNPNSLLQVLPNQATSTDRVVAVPDREEPLEASGTPNNDEERTKTTPSEGEGEETPAAELANGEVKAEAEQTSSKVGEENLAAGSEKERIVANGDRAEDSTDSGEVSAPLSGGSGELESESSAISEGSAADGIGKAEVKGNGVEEKEKPAAKVALKKTEVESGKESAKTGVSMEVKATADSSKQGGAEAVVGGEKVNGAGKKKQKSSGKKRK